MIRILANAPANFWSDANIFKFSIICGVIGFLVVMVGKPLWRAYHERKLPPLVDRLGLTYTRFGGEGSTTVTGSYRNVPVYLYEEVHGWGKYKHTRSYYQIKLNPADVPTDLTVFREDLASKAAKVFGSEDIQIGREQIDSKFIIQGAFTEDAIEFFARPNVAVYFVQLQKLCRDFRLENNLLILEFRRGIAIERDQLRERLEALSRCAHAIAQTDPKLAAKQISHAPKKHPEPIDIFAAPVNSRTNPPKQQDNSKVHW